MNTRLQRCVKISPAVLAISGSFLFAAVAPSHAATQAQPVATSVVVSLYGDGSQQSVEVDPNLDPQNSHALLSGGRIGTIVVGTKGGLKVLGAGLNPDNPQTQILFVRDPGVTGSASRTMDLDGDGVADILFVGSQFGASGGVPSDAGTANAQAATNGDTTTADANTKKGPGFNPATARFNLAPQGVKQFAGFTFAGSMQWGVQRPTGFSFNTQAGVRRFRY